MWHVTTSAAKGTEKRTQRRGQLTVVMLLLLDVALPSPPSHGWIARLTLPVHQLMPVGIPSLTAVAVVLAGCYWLFRSPQV